MSKLMESSSALEFIDSQASSARLLSNHLQRTLRLAGLEVEGEMSSVDSFAFSGAQHVSTHIDETAKRSGYRIKYEETQGYSRIEPRMHLIKRSLERFLRCGVFYTNGVALSVDGFRWVDLQQWANYKTDTFQSNVGALSGYCNCDCEFCFEMGGREAGLPFGRRMLSLREVATRAKYYSTDTHEGLLTSSSFELEAFLNPRALDIIELIRSVDTETYIGLITNGTFLTEDVVARLAKSQPILINLSLNASSPETWRRSMRGPEHMAEIPFRALSLLKEYEITTISSYVPWPSKPMSDLEDAVLYMDEMDVVRARICLPSFTRFHSRNPLFETETYWAEVLNTVQSVRQKVRIPVIYMPAFFEFKTSFPIVRGTVKGSPAEKAGIRFGDRILAVNGEEVFTIPQTRGLLRERTTDPEIASTAFTVQRDSELFDIVIPHSDQNVSDFPYSALISGGHRKYIQTLGIYLTDGFPITHIVRLAEICREFLGKRILLFTSEFMEPHFKEALAMVDGMAELLDQVEFYVEKPYHKFFGGNVVIADLWMVSDLVAHARKWIADTGIRPDVVVAPSSFLSAGKRDLLGVCYLEFERELDMELRLVPCSPMSDV
jgi:wyosine [tRNA(Phe)-imidazoG37] synthetase (radical SAM superfamily)